MNRHEWSELALVGAAAIYNGMSYGFYVAAGMPNLERFKRAVDKGEYVPVRKGRRGSSDHGAVEIVKQAVKPAKPREQKPREVKPKVDKRAERKNLVCLMCKEPFVAEIKAGPLPKYCPTCKEARRKAMKREDARRQRERMKAGELRA